MLALECVPGHGGGRVRRWWLRPPDGRVDGVGRRGEVRGGRRGHRQQRRLRRREEQRGLVLLLVDVLIDVDVLVLVPEALCVLADLGRVKKGN